jgi:hypothetical protein
MTELKVLNFLSFVEIFNVKSENVGYVSLELGVDVFFIFFEELHQYTYKLLYLALNCIK